MQKDFPEYRHTDHLTIPTLQTRPHTPDSFNPQMNKEKESRDFPVASLVRPPPSLLVDQSPFGSRGSRALHSELELTKQKLLHEARSKKLHFLLPLKELSSRSPFFQPTQHRLASSPSLLPLQQLSLNVPTTRPSRQPRPRLVLGSTPLLGVPPLSPPIGRADTPSARQRDRWAFPQPCLADSVPELP